MAVCSGVARAPSFAFPRVSGARTTTGRARAFRCRASDSEDGVARVRVFTGGRKEALFGARENMLSLLERGATDDAAIEAAIEELSGMNPTEAPARDPKLIGTWRLMWSKQAETANPFQRAFGALAKDNFQILNADDTLENLVRLGPLTVSARAPVKATSDTRVEVSISTIDISLFGNVVKTMRMTPKPGRGAGYVEQLFLDDALRVSRGNKGSVFVHRREDGDSPGGAETTAGNETPKTTTSLTVTRTGGTSSDGS